MQERAWLSRIALGFVTVVAVSACGSSGDDPVVDTSIAFRYEPTAADWFATPWPADNRVLADGTVDLSMVAGSDKGFMSAVRAAIEAHVTGFSTMQVGYFQLLDDPGDAVLIAPSESLAPGASVQLVSVEPGSCGEPVPVETKLSHTTDDPFLPSNVLEIAPVSGFVLDQGGAYAFIVRTNFGDPVGRATKRPEALGPVLTGDAAGPAADALAPLRACAAAGDLSLDDVAMATVFHVQDVIGQARALRDAVADPAYSDAPVISDWAASPTYVGNDFTGFTATYETPIFQRGVSPYEEDGDIVFGQDGRPVIQRWEQVPMLLLVPNTAAPHPVLLWVDGTGWGQWNHVWDTLTQDLLAAGFAVASYMPQFHGDRATPGSDPEVHTYNFLNPTSGRNVLRQQLADTSYFIRVLREAVPAQLGAPELDTTNLVFGGQSQGSQNGAMMAAVEPDVHSFVLNGLAAYLTVTVLERKDGADYEALLKFILGIHDEIDRFHPALSLLQLGGDSVDLHNYAPSWKGWADKPAGAHLFVLNGHNDTTTAPMGIDAITIAGDLAPIDPPGWDVDPFGVWSRSAEALPIAANRTAFDGGDLTQATHLDADTGHFTIYDRPAERARAVAFLVSALSGVPTIAP